MRLPDHPDEDMPVEYDITQLEFFFVAVLVSERGFEFSFSFQVEFLDFDLFREVDTVLRHPFVNGLFCTPVYGQLFIFLVFVEVLDLFFGQSFLFYRREIPVEGFDVDSEIVFLMGDYGHVFLGVGYADIGDAVFEKRLSVVMMSEIDFFFEHFVQKCSYGKFLFAEAVASYQGNFFHFIGRD